MDRPKGLDGQIHLPDQEGLLEGYDVYDLVQESVQRKAQLELTPFRLQPMSHT